MEDSDWELVCKLLPFMVPVDRKSWLQHLINIKGPVPAEWVERLQAAGADLNP